MKNLILILLSILIYSCQIKIKNDGETLDKIFKLQKFEIEIKTQSCFGENTDLFNVLKLEDKYLIKSERTKKSHIISNENIDSLHNYLINKIGKKEYGGCTIKQYIRVGTKAISVDYEHSYCLGIEATIINDLLDYYKLTTEKGATQ